MNPKKLNFGTKKITQELEVFGAVFVLFAVLALSIYFGINSGAFNFDTRNEAAGKTIFLENGGDLQAAIDSASTSDAIFLKPGSYTSTVDTGFSIVNKNIRILGSGEAYTSILANNKDYGFNATNSKVSFESLKISGAKKDGVISASNSSELSFKDVHFVGNVGTAVNTSGKTTVREGLIDQNGEGIKTVGPLILENVVIQNSVANGISIVASTSTENIIRNIVLYKNTGTALSISGGSNSIKNVSLSENGNGIIETSNSSTTKISNSVVYKSTGEGISLKGANSAVTYSNSFSNTTSNYNPATLSNLQGNTAVDPGFVSATELQLRVTSSLKGKGNPDDKNADGTRIDIGAFGGNPNLTASNHAPVVNSVPTEFVKPGQTYSYEIKATDQDGDQLSYVVLNNNIPSWLSQDGNKFLGTPNASQVGYYGIMVVVSDLKGGNIVHPISINVLPADRDIPVTNGGVDPTPTSTPVSPTITPKVTINTPTAASVFSKDSKEITWSVNSGAVVDSYEVKYSSDGQNFTSIVKLPGDVTSYTWSGVDSLVSGKYFIRVEATDKATPPLTVGTTSQQFEINNNVSTGTEAITITKNSPADNDVVTSKRQLIVVEFKPDADVDKSKTILKVNGQNVTYETTKNTIFYQPTSDYTGTTTTVEVQLVTTKGGNASKKWQFNIQGTTTPQNTTPASSTDQTIFGLPRNIGLGLLGCLILVLLILILYFVVRFIKTIRDEREGNLDAEFTEYYEPSTTDTTKQVVVQETLPQNDNTDMSQYYTEETTTQTSETQSPSIQDYATETTEQNNQVVENQQPTQTEYETTTTENVVAETTQPQVEVANQQEPQQYYESDQTPVDNQVQVATTDQQQTQTSVQTDTGLDEDYIQKLKQKYQVDDAKIAEYNEAQQNPSDVDANGQPIDPTQASTPPVKGA